MNVVVLQTVPAVLMIVARLKGLSIHALLSVLLVTEVSVFGLDEVRYVLDLLASRKFCGCHLDRLYSLM